MPNKTRTPMEDSMADRRMDDNGRGWYACEHGGAHKSAKGADSCPYRGFHVKALEGEVWPSRVIVSTEDGAP